MRNWKKETIDIAIKDIRNIFRLEKGNKAFKDRILRDIKNVLRLEKENKAIKDRVLRDITNILEHDEEENCYKPVTVSTFWSNNYIQ